MRHSLLWISHSVGRQVWSECTFPPVHTLCIAEQMGHPHMPHSSQSRGHSPARTEMAHKTTSGLGCWWHECIHLLKHFEQCTWDLCIFLCLATIKFKKQIKEKRKKNLFNGVLNALTAKFQQSSENLQNHLYFAHLTKFTLLSLERPIFEIKIFLNFSTVKV